MMEPTTYYCPICNDGISYFPPIDQWEGFYKCDQCDSQFTAEELGVE